MDKKLKFAKELSLIQDQEVKQFAEYVVENLPEYFFHVAASSTGKYHPAYALGEGGLLRHTQAACRIAKELFVLESIPFSFLEKDIILCALILHDGWKHGIQEAHFTVATHPEIAVQQLKELYGKNPKVSLEVFNLICSGIHSHMGQWNVEYRTNQVILPKPETKMQRFIHMCDYLASRKCIEVILT